MGSTAVEIDPRLISFGLPSVPESVRMARFHVRTTLGFYELDEYANDAAAVASELVTNAIQHVPGGGAEMVVVTLVRTWNPEAVTIVVWILDQKASVRTRDTSANSERGRMTQTVEALSVYWGRPTAKTAGKSSSRYSKEAGERRRDGAAASTTPPSGSSASVAASIRYILRQRTGWSLAQLGELMGRQSASTVCAAEGRRGGRRRGFTAREIERLAAIFDISPASISDTVRELRRPPADRIRLPGLRSHTQQRSTGRVWRDSLVSLQDR